MFDSTDIPEAELALLRAILRFVAVLCPTLIAAAMGLAVWQGWPWWGWIMAVAGAFWSAPLTWGAWAATRPQPPRSLAACRIRVPGAAFPELKAWLPQ
jgi:hypothetical protein